MSAREKQSKIVNYCRRANVLITEQTLVEFGCQQCSKICGTNAPVCERRIREPVVHGVGASYERLFSLVTVIPPITDFRLYREVLSRFGISTGSLKNVYWCVRLKFVNANLVII